MRARRRRRCCLERREHGRQAAARDLPARRRPHVPDRAAVPAHVDRGQRSGRRLRPRATDDEARGSLRPKRSRSSASPTCADAIAGANSRQGAAADGARARARGPAAGCCCSTRSSPGSPRRGRARSSPSSGSSPPGDHDRDHRAHDARDGAAGRPLRGSRSWRGARRRARPRSSRATAGDRGLSRQEVGVAHAHA